MENIQEIISTVVSKVPDAQVLSDLDATVAWVKRSAKATPRRLGVTGFCWGGRIVWLYSAHNPNLKAGVAWYGRLVNPPDELRPKNPIDVVGDPQGPRARPLRRGRSGHPRRDGRKDAAALKEAKKPAEIILYPDTPHAFYADYRPSYRKTEAADGWKRMLAWFKQYGVA